jgi:hypothetical protein
MHKNQHLERLVANAIKISDQLNFVHSMPQANAQAIAQAVRIDRLSDGVVHCVGLYITASPNAPGNVYASTATSDDRRLDPTYLTGTSSPKTLKVVCDTLIIPCRWWLPECDVEISARRIVFENDGCIDTSPAPWSVDKAANASGKQPGGRGANGRAAGDITVLAGEVVLPAGSRAKRLIARGGHGQGAGHGIAGTDGRDSPYNQLGIKGTYTHNDRYTDSGVRTKVAAVLNKHADHTIIGIRSKWNVAAFATMGEYTWGTLELPSSGTDAVAPGDAGNGGNGGRIFTNRTELLGLCDAPAGRAGAAAPEAKGGRAGYPAKCGYYDNLYYHCFNIAGLWKTFADEPYENENSGSAKIEWHPHEAKAGASKSASAGQDGKAWEPEEAKSLKTNTWLHPYIVPVMLDFIRRAYLSEQREDAATILDAYEAAFRDGMPAKAKATEWEPEDEPYWLSVGLELAAVSQRMAAGLDYFGNPAGYAPLLSLAGSFRQYQLELDSALEVLVFVGWLGAKQRARKDARDASKIAAGLLTRENKTVAGQIGEVERAVDDIRDRITAISGNERDLLARIGVIRTDLTNKASGEADKIAQIKFAANLAAGLLQLVPYGQPVLGNLASTAVDAIDYLDEEPDVVTEKVKTRIKNTVEAYKDAQKASKDLVKEAKESAKELAKADGKDLTVDQIKKLNATSAPAWKTAAKGIGPALNHFKTAYEKAQVTRAQIDARMAKLAAADPEWQKLTRELGELADDKAKLLADITAMAQSIGQKFAVLAGNSAAIERLDSQSASAAAQMLGTAAQQVIAEMGQRAIMALTEALYNLVRAFESVRLESVTVDWSNESFLAELNRLIDAEPMDSWSDDKVQARIKTLGIAFRENLRRIRGSLAKGASVSATTSSRDFSLDSGLGDDRLDALNAGEWISIDTMELDFVAPDRQHHLLAGIEPISVSFADSEPLPRRGDLEILIELDQVGIVRGGTQLFGLRLISPVTHCFTYHFGTGEFTRDKPSDSANDLLNIVLDDLDARIRQRMALPSAWTTMRAKISFPGRRGGTVPQIKAINLRAAIESQPARDMRVLHATSHDGFTPLTLKRDGEDGGQTSTELLAGYFIFPTDRARVGLVSAEPDRPVGNWHVTRGDREQNVDKPALDLKIDLHTRVDAEFAR